METTIKWVYIITLLLIISACRKSDFLDEKPSTNINQPKTLLDFQQLLDNTSVMNYTGGLSQLASDEYEVSYSDYQLGTSTERNSYIWAKNIFTGDVSIQDWNVLYKEVFYANVVLEGLAKSDSAATEKGQNIKGWALFTRAFAFYDLTKNFCKVYDANSANSDLGIPIRISSSIDYLQQRSTLQQSFDQVLTDLTASIPLLQASRPSSNLNRPSKLAAYALLARIYLDMRNYAQAEYYTDQCLNLYSTLIDYNTVSKTSSTPFLNTNNELICNKVQVPTYSYFTQVTNGSTDKVSPDLFRLYSPSDLRLQIYFVLGTDGKYCKKRGYNGSGFYHFTGLATDELYLIKAECLARRGETTVAMAKLNQLLIKRYDNTITYTPLTASSATDALSKILLERRKELVWRGLRWHDLKRLNKEGANITLSRTLNSITYTLIPNDPKYVFPIPDDEVALSRIEQNIR